MKIQEHQTQLNQIHQAAQYRLSSKLTLFLQSCSPTGGNPLPIPSGLELDPNPGMDDQRFNLFCSLLAAEDVFSNLSIVGGGDGAADAGDEFCVLAVLLVLAEEPVVLGDW
jgi:hypothetical protein